MSTYQHPQRVDKNDFDKPDETSKHEKCEKRVAIDWRITSQEILQKWVS